jgi:hypothetical protein
VERPIKGLATSIRSAFSRARRLRSAASPLDAARLVVHARWTASRALVTRFAPRHPSRRCLGSPRAGSPAAALADRSASRGDPGRVRPTDATHIVKDEHPCVRQPAAPLPAKAGSAAEPGASTAPNPLLPAHRAAAPSVLDSARATWGWFLAPRHRPGDAERLNAQSIDPSDRDRFCPPHH